MAEKRRPKPIDRIVLKRLTIAGLASCLILLFFYWIGNFQEFLDSSLLSILDILGWTAPLTALLALFGLISALVRRKPGDGWALSFPGMAGYLAAVAFCSSLFVLALFLSSVLGRS